MNYYIADTHFFHANIIKLNNRPFKDVIEMNETLISNWNKKVKENDTIYILGDFAYKTYENNVLYLLDRLNGNKILVTGNHDGIILKSPNLRKKFSKIISYLEVNDNGKHIILFHYPIAEWNGFFKDNTYHFYGHIHNNKNEVFYIMEKISHAFNVGVDVINFEPKTAEEIINNK